MTEEMLESWLDRALKDRKTSFQSGLFEKLEMHDELDALKKNGRRSNRKNIKRLALRKLVRTIITKGSWLIFSGSKTG